MPRNRHALIIKSISNKVMDSYREIKLMSGVPIFCQSLEGDTQILPILAGGNFASEGRKASTPVLSSKLSLMQTPVVCICKL